MLRLAIPAMLLLSACGDSRTDWQRALVKRECDAEMASTWATYEKSLPKLEAAGEESSLLPGWLQRSVSGDSELVRQQAQRAAQRTLITTGFRDRCMELRGF